MIDNRRPHGRFRGPGVVLLCCALAVIAGALAPSHTIRVGNALADALPQAGTSLDVALAGTATVSSEASGSPASAAIDGDTSTSWAATA